MRVRIDDRLCQGHAMCILACPELFDLSDEDGHAFVAQTEVPADLEDKIDQAIRGCPEGAIQSY